MMNEDVTRKTSAEDTLLHHTKTAPCNQTHLAMIKAWSHKQISPWLGRRLDYDTCIEDYKEMNANIGGFYLFRIVDGSVSIIEKPSGLTINSEERSILYAKFLQDVIRIFCPSLSVCLGIFCGDAGAKTSSPIFSFQKTSDQNSLLLPDVDFIRDSFFYPYREFHDELEYYNKDNKAIFVGSTSGHPVTQNTIRDLSHPRIRSALYFKESCSVEFYIANLVQYDSNDTRDLLLSMGFGKCGHISWKEQFNRRFIISMDGNGATCSRIPITLRSNSILMKYDSDSSLFYFSGMVPWLHYVPIKTDDDVERIIDLERRGPGRFSYIVENSHIFAKKYLSRFRIMQYTAYLLNEYAYLFNVHIDLICDSPRCDTPEARFGGVVAHIATRGDVWYPANLIIGEKEPGNYIEGFMVEPGCEFALDELSYQAILYDGKLSDWCDGGIYVGSRGQSQAIKGFRLRLSTEISKRYSVCYAGEFADGFATEFLPHGELCRSPTAAPLQLMQLQFKRLEDVA